MSGQVRRYMAEYEFDVVHLNGIFPPDISFWALKHSRAVNVLTFHTVAFATSPLAARLCRVLFGRYNRLVHGRIAVSNGALEFIRPYFPGGYRVIREGVDLRRFRPGPDRPEPARRILFLGRLEPRKGLVVLLRALPQVLRAIPDAQLEIAGTGPLETEARALVRRLGIGSSVSFLGYLPGAELPACYARADVYCAPALGGEAFGIVLLEAMAGGAAVVASDITGYNEVVEPGTSGLLVPPGDSPALARAIIRLLTDPDLRIRLRTGGLVRAEHHSWPRVTADIVNYYRELLDRAGPTQRPCSKRIARLNVRPGIG
jgi:phosphatidylinositol alpha-mannosyltransferase